LGATKKRRGSWDFGKAGRVGIATIRRIEMKDKPARLMSDILVGYGSSGAFSDT
jgi:hypothetical protein